MKCVSLSMSARGSYSECCSFRPTNSRVSTKECRIGTSILLAPGMRKTRRKQLAECNSSKTTRRRKTGRKLTRRMIIKCKLVEFLQVTHCDDSVLIMI